MELSLCWELSLYSIVASVPWGKRQQRNVTFPKTETKAINTFGILIHDSFDPPCLLAPSAAAVFYLGELALLVDERDDVHRLGGDHVKSILVVSELDVLPVDVLQVILLLLQLEDVTHKELLQILVGKVDAELLKTKKILGRRKYMLGTFPPL